MKTCKEIHAYMHTCMYGCGQSIRGPLVFYLPKLHFQCGRLWYWWTWTKLNQRCYDRCDSYDSYDSSHILVRGLIISSAHWNHWNHWNHWRQQSWRGHRGTGHLKILGLLGLPGLARKQKHNWNVSWCICFYVFGEHMSMWINSSIDPSANL